MTDLVEDLTEASPSLAGGRSGGFMRKLKRRLAVEAPSDHDEVMAQVRQLPPWVGVALAVGFSAASWAAIILGVAYVRR